MAHYILLDSLVQLHGDRDDFAITEPDPDA
jgi:hypothetical protein